jgi:3D (Asp-Asp-Asp) domain-containing protein
MIIMQEARSLILIKGYYNASLDVYVFTCEGKKITLQYMTDEQIAKLFQKAQVKDSSLPRSGREKTYLEMVAGIKDGSDTECAIWTNYIDIFFETADNLRKSRIGVSVK